MCCQHSGLYSTVTPRFQVKLWQIPDGGLEGPLTEWITELRGHKRRVGHLEWHPTAQGVLASAGSDGLVIVWDVGKGEAVSAIACHPDAVHSLSFNREGSLLATTCKDKKLRIIEPRKGIVLSVSFYCVQPEGEFSANQPFAIPGIAYRPRRNECSLPSCIAIGPST